MPFSPISEGPTKAQSDIADHGYRTKCPPMKRCNYENDSEPCLPGGGHLVERCNYENYSKACLPAGGHLEERCYYENDSEPCLPSGRLQVEG
jgi:hypothetical protein